MAVPLVSIIIPVYNVDKYLRQCLDSVLAQTIPNFEALLVNDGSTDKSGSICEEYSKMDCRFRVYHTENRGSAAARQFGFEQAKGEFIVAVDSDDWVDIAYLEKMLSCIINYDADCVVSAFWCNKDGKDNYRENRPSAFDITTLITDVFTHKYHAGLWNKMFKRSILMNGEIRTPRHSYYEDMFVYVSYLQYANKVVYSDCASYHYRCRKESLTNRQDLSIRIKMASQALYNLRDLYNQFVRLREGLCYKALCSTANNEKLRLLYEYPSDYKIYRKTLCRIFPNTYTLRDVKGYGTLRIYLAINGWLKI